MRSVALLIHSGTEAMELLLFTHPQQSTHHVVWSTHTTFPTISTSIISVALSTDDGIFVGIH